MEFTARTLFKPRFEPLPRQSRTETDCSDDVIGRLMLERLHAGRELQTVAALHGSSLVSGSGGPPSVKQPSSRPSSRSSTSAQKPQPHLWRRAGLRVRQRWWINKCLLSEGMGGWLQSSTSLSFSQNMRPCHQIISGEKILTWF